MFHKIYHCSVLFFLYFSCYFFSFFHLFSFLFFFLIMKHIENDDRNKHAHLVPTNFFYTLLPSEVRTQHAHETFPRSQRWYKHINLSTVFECSESGWNGKKRFTTDSSNLKNSFLNYFVLKENNNVGLRK